MSQERPTSSETAYMRSIRVYADTSVFGGVFDDEFEVASRAFFAQVRLRRFARVTSPIVEEEISAAPEPVRQLFNEVLESTEVVDVTDEAMRLQTAYLEARIVSIRSATDALHVALATVAACGLIVSWNFQHIVHFDKIPLYNAVNVRCGYPAVTIWSPSEVIDYEDKDL